ncbi:hypothetical protein HS1genome_1207 [Sulfodiicoccus acidiphilus]|uniref:TRASH domain-containing protein n=1 Tax=Sulfodiicoccus acidiphilus TaxID=1670455 RepID=A0A348B3R6_9CREN|nr:TRASH domain-containing protein [Sulfodiicoccus acidiphilus]BBD72818.1 hypothetical protein HS1genome_1207 [Sulfodiicoccus acidiphilus]GGU04255.1 hypothetical protein GCM10007116_21180 [Sulfodiicoccus acidiphilus]
MGNNDEVEVSELEQRAIEVLRNDSRIPLRKLAQELNVSRSTAARVISALKKKGIKFTVNVPEPGFVAFVIIESKVSSEAYRAIDGRVVNLIRAKTLEELTEKLGKIKGKRAVIVARQESGFALAGLSCDYCGGKIRGDPLTYRRGRKVFYLCCRTCLSEIRSKYSHRSKNIKTK